MVEQSHTIPESICKEYLTIPWAWHYRPRSSLLYYLCKSETWVKNSPWGCSARGCWGGGGGAATARAWAKGCRGERGRSREFCLFSGVFVLFLDWGRDAVFWEILLKLRLFWPGLCFFSSGFGLKWAIGPLIRGSCVSIMLVSIIQLSKHSLVK